MSTLGLVGVESWACGGADIPLSSAQLKRKKTLKKESNKKTKISTLLKPK